MVNVVLFLPAGNQQVDAIHVTQLERDTVLVCLDREYNLAASPSVQMGLKESFLQPLHGFSPQKI